jgi:hypothetical protein
VKTRVPPCDLVLEPQFGPLLLLEISAAVAGNDSAASNKTGRSDSRSNRRRPGPRTNSDTHVSAERHQVRAVTRIAAPLNALHVAVAGSRHWRPWPCVRSTTRTGTAGDQQLVERMASVLGVIARSAASAIIALTRPHIAIADAQPATGRAMGLQRRHGERRVGEAARSVARHTGSRGTLCGVPSPTADPSQAGSGAA